MAIGSSPSLDRVLIRIIRQATTAKAIHCTIQSITKNITVQRQRKLEERG